MDPNLLQGMGDFLKNPDMLKNAMDMLKNNPAMMEKMANFGKKFAQPQTNLEQTDFKLDTPVTIKGLKSDTYNNQEGLIKKFNPESKRFEIFLPDLDKTISIKQKNFKRNIIEPDVEEPESDDEAELDNKDDNVDNQENSKTDA